MKLIIAIVNKEDEKSLSEGLSKNNFSATRIESQGLFLGKERTTFLIGIEDNKVSEVAELIKKCCKSRNENVSPTPHTMEPGELIIPEAEKITTSGAVIFVLEVSDFFKL